MCETLSFSVTLAMTYTPPFTSAMSNFPEKYKHSTTFQNRVNESYVRYATDRQTDNYHKSVAWGELYFKIMCRMGH